jgi:hypothetical protein
MSHREMLRELIEAIDAYRNHHCSGEGECSIAHALKAGAVYGCKFRRSLEAMLDKARPIADYPPGFRIPDANLRQEEILNQRIHQALLDSEHESGEIKKVEVEQ